MDLVTGGAGFIGSHLVDRLLLEGRRVRVVDNLSVGRESNLTRHRGDPRLELIVGDVGDAALMRQAAAGVDRLFHLAGLADIVPSIENPSADVADRFDYVLFSAEARPGERSAKKEGAKDATKPVGAPKTTPAAKSKEGA